MELGNSCKESVQFYLDNNRTNNFFFSWKFTIKSYLLDYNFLDFQIVPSMQQLVTFIILFELFDCVDEEFLHHKKNIDLFNFYRTFRIEISSPWSLFCVQLVYTLFTMHFIKLLYFLEFSIFTWAIILIAIFIIIVPFWLLFYYRFYYNRTKCMEYEYYYFFCGIESCILLGFIFTFGTIALINIIDNKFHIASQNKLIIDMKVRDLIFILQVTPLILTRVFCYIQAQIILVAYFSIFIIIITGFIFQEQNLSIISIIFLLFSTFFLHLVSQCQLAYIFLISRRYHEIMEIRTNEIEESSSKLSLEMKNMITSLSHDLKSVSFL